MQCFSVQEGRLQLNLGPLEVKEAFSEELFTRRNLKPIVLFCGTGGGKTVTCVDVFRVCLAAGYNQFNYITSNYIGKENDYLRSQVLEQCVVSEDYLVKLRDIIKEAKDSQNERQYEMLIAQAEKIMAPHQQGRANEIKAQYLSQMREGDYDKTFIQRSFGVSGAIDQIFRDSSDPIKFKQLFEANRGQLEKLFVDTKFDYVSFGDGQVSKQKCFNCWSIFINDVYEKYKEEYKHFCIDVVKTKAMDKLRENSQPLQDYIRGGRCSDDDLLNYFRCIEEPRKICLVIDDLSHFLKSGAGNSKIEIDGSVVKEKDGFQMVLNIIMNQGRHLGTIILAVHSTQGFSADTQKLISNIMVNPLTNQIGNNRSLFIAEKGKKEEVERILEKLAMWNLEQNSRYQLLCFRDPDQSPDGKSEYVLYQANYVSTPYFNYEMYKNAPFFYKLAEAYAKRAYGPSLIAQQQLSLGQKEVPEIQKIQAQQNKRVENIMKEPDPRDNYLSDDDDEEDDEYED